MVVFGESLEGQNSLPTPQPSFLQITNVSPERVSFFQVEGIIFPEKGWSWSFLFGFRFWTYETRNLIHTGLARQGVAYHV